MKYHLVITGATGFVGRAIVPYFQRAGIDLLLVGRDTGKLQEIWPDLARCTYEELGECGSGFDAILHLAVLNNNSKASYDEYEAVNSRLLIDVASVSVAIGIKKFINVSSIHALDKNNLSDYAVTKRLGKSLLDQMNGLCAVTCYLPIVYSQIWPGNLRFLNFLPKTFANLIFRALSAFKPSVSAEHLASTIMQIIGSRDHQDCVIADSQENNLFFAASKRFVDLSFAAFVIVGFWWMLLILWLLVRIDSPGPGLFVQRRVGRNGKSFNCWKFRTMQINTLQAGTHEISPAAVTNLGRLLRQTKLDELPQVWNILRNELSLIGPRPCLPVQKQLIKERERYGVLNIKPGISGFAQVNKIDMSDPDTLAKWDLHYVRLQSIELDVSIMMQTAFGRGQGDRVQKKVA